jgi:hypothetical protein
MWCSFFGNEHKNKDIDQKDIVNVITMLHANKFKVCKNVMQCHSFLPDFFLLLVKFHHDHMDKRIVSSLPSTATSRNNISSFHPFFFVKLFFLFLLGRGCCF